MTMRAIADELGVSIPTLYRRLKAEGVNVADLRDPRTGKVTPAGAAVIADVFRDTTNNTVIQEIINRDSQTVSSDTAKQDTDAMVRAAVCAAKLEAAEATITRLEDELTRLRNERDKLLTMLEVEQRQRQMLLTDGRRHGGLFGWLKRIRDTNTNTNTNGDGGPVGE